MNRLAIFLLSGLLNLPGCQTTPSQVEERLETAETIQSTAMESDENAKANAFFERAFEETLSRSPMYQSYLGIKDNQHLWDDLSEEKVWQDLDVTMRQLTSLKSEIDRDKLNDQARISYDLFVKNAEDEIANFRWRHHNYPINQMRGGQSWIPSFLINIHRITEKQDALDYVSRLEGIAAVVAELIKQMDKREAMGIVPPRFVFPKVISDSENVLTGSPFEAGEQDSTLLGDFREKVHALEITQLEKDVLIDQAKNVLQDSVGPAYRSLIQRLKQQQKIASTDDGAWKFPNGKDFYNAALKNTTTTNLTADEIHDIGLSEVARIHGEMRSIMQKVAFKGSLQDFFAFTREDKQFYYPQTEAGRQAYLSKAESIINTMKTRLDEMFITKPKADLTVKAVEAFREKSAGKAFYQRGTPDGSRPGVYYANLYRMEDMPKYQMEALAYHEGIPGHHLQGSIASELEGIPRFRKFGHFTAYSEGWGLYSEFLPKEMGFYSDPYSDFGRLAMEIWRACRLVVDTGIHAKRWTREQAINYLEENTPNPRGDIVKAIERYIVLPSQATAYKIGMNKIIELRESARSELGAAFNIREFHDVVLRNGPLPLDMLEDSVKDWINRHQ